MIGKKNKLRGQGETILTDPFKLLPRKEKNSSR